MDLTDPQRKPELKCMCILQRNVVCFGGSSGYIGIVDIGSEGEELDVNFTSCTMVSYYVSLLSALEGDKFVIYAGCLPST